MTAWLRALLSSSDASADSIVVGGLFALLTGCIIALYVAFRNGSFSFGDFSLFVGATLAAMGGAKTARDRWSRPNGDKDARILGEPPR